MTAYVCRIDRSPNTGTLVACTCGFVVGPFMDVDRAVSVAKSHRDIHTADVNNARQRERRRRRE